MKTVLQRKNRPRGLTLLESMLMLTVLAVIAVATGVGLQAASKVPSANDKILIIDAELNSEMDYWKAWSFASTAPWPTTFPYTKNDNVTLTINGKATSLARSLTISRWDPNDITNNSSPQNDFVKVVITIDGQSITFYMSALL
jgi:hypothetical protein